jgi:hypothetical protein
MTVCTRHDYGGPKLCPACQRDAAELQRDTLAKALEEADAIRARLEAEVDRLRKEHAVACLQLLDRAFIGTVEEGIADLERGKTDPAVVSLVRDHHQHPLDTCRRCGRPAPCREDDGVCSWGCPS